MPEPATVLIVDDDDAFRRALARTLSAAGYACVEAGDAPAARELLAESDDVAAVLCDVRMPGESGLDLLKQISADLPDVAVVMVTGVDDPATAQLAFDIGAYGYLTKPFERNEILVSLAGALSRRRLETLTRHHLVGLERTVERMQALHATIEGLDAAGESDDETIERLSRALSLRDEETGMHIERMSRYAALVADAAETPGTTSEEVRLVTALHDVGKIGIADTILRKPGALSPVEYVTMQRHAQIGYQLLAGASSPLVRRAADVAHCHHEWWDGGGYPRGLSGEEIPADARVAAVTDVFDALTSDRVYRPGLPVDEALSMMQELRGRQFEPRLIDAFVETMPDVLAVRRRFPDRPDETRIRVLVVDDHAMFVESLARLLGGAPDVTVVGEAASVAEAVAKAGAYQPDVVLMDFELPDGTGVDALHRVKGVSPGSRVVMLTGRTDRSALTRALDAGCAGFVTKLQASEQLLDAIRAAYEGETAIAGHDLGLLLDGLRPSRRGLAPALGPREVEVVELMAEGLSNKQIAQRLFLSVNTVRNHVQSVLYKLNAHSKLEAVATAVREGIVDRNRARPGA
jgi:putative two-component system response regulator